MPIDLHMEFQQRITRTEARVDVLDDMVEKHDFDIKDLGAKLDTLVGEVRNIRNALWFLAAAAAANVPALNGIARTLKVVLFG